MVTDFVAKRVVKKGSVELSGTPEQVFPLLCPVKEIDWVEGWEQVSQLIFSKSGFAEEGCIFTSNLPHEGQAVWICSHYDPQAKQIEFYKVITDKAVVKLTLHVLANQDRYSMLEFTYIMTGLNNDGNQFIDHYMEQGSVMFMTMLEKGLNHYLTTGTILRGYHNV